MGTLLNEGSKSLGVRWVKLFVVSTMLISIVWIAFANHILGEADIIKAVVDSALIGIAIATAQLVLDPRPHGALPHPPAFISRPPAAMAAPAAPAPNAVAAKPFAARKPKKKSSAKKNKKN